MKNLTSNNGLLFNRLPRIGVIFPFYIKRVFQQHKGNINRDRWDLMQNVTHLTIRTSAIAGLFYS